MHSHGLHPAHSSSKMDVSKWKSACYDLYAPEDGILQQFRPASTSGRKYVCIRKNLNKLIAELHIMQKEADTEGRIPSVNEVQGSEYYT